MINYSLNPQRVATGSSYGASPDDEHAYLAVEQALKKMDDESIGSVLLFLTSAYAHAPQKAIKNAAKAAGTPQIFGCCSLHLLTEQEWLMDVEGAVAMVFPRDIALQPLTVMQRLNIAPSCVLTLSSPNASTIAVNSTSHRQIGAISSDEYGHGPYSVWQSGRVEEHEFSLSAFPDNLETHIIVANSIKRLSNNQRINLTNSHSLLQVNERRALDSLPIELQKTAQQQPYNLLCAISENSDIKSLESGHFKLHHVVSANNNTGEIQLSGRPKSGRHLFWAVRDPQEAEQSIRRQVTELQETLTNQPLFGLMFPNIGRGPEFFDGSDKDLDCFQAAFPDTPLIGFYGNGEITPGVSNKGLIRRYSTVLAVYCDKNAQP